MASTANNSGKNQRLAQHQSREKAKRRKKQGIIFAVSGLVILVLFFASSFMILQANKRDQANSVKNLAFVNKIIGTPSSSYDRVGVGAVKNFPAKVPDVSQSPSGKPRIVFYGAEFCPYCAMERWSVVAALSRFGTWSGLKGEVSSEGNIPTVNFKNAKYTSKYLDFASYELMDQNHQKLQTPSKSDSAFLEKYDDPKYFKSMSADQKGAIPFISFGGVQISSGASFDASMSMGGQKADTIANNLTNLSDPTTQGILGESNIISAQICKQNPSAPKNVCNSAGVKAALAKIS